MKMICFKSPDLILRHYLPNERYGTIYYGGGQGHADYEQCKIFFHRFAFVPFFHKMMRIRRSLHNKMFDNIHYKMMDNK